MNPQKAGAKISKEVCKSPLSAPQAGDALAGALGIQLISCESCAVHEIAPPGTSTYLIGLMYAGKAILTLGSKQFEVPEGYLWAIFPGQSPQWHHPHREFSQAIVLRLKGKQCPFLVEGYGLSEKHPAHVAEYPLRSQLLLEQIQDRFNSVGMTHPLFLLTRLLRIAEYQCEPAKAKAPKRNTEIVARIKQIYRERPSASVFTISKQLKVSPSTLRKACNEVLNISAQKYLSRLRQDWAKELLYSTANKIVSVASQIGFSNEKYFTTWFKKREGLTPSEWRKRIISPHNPKE